MTVCTYCRKEGHRAHACPLRKRGLPALLATLLLATPAVSHDWYPIECCSSMDCAPAQTQQMVGASMFVGVAPMIVTTKYGSVVVPANFKYRDSPDGQMHACMAPNGDGTMRLICLFMPPNS